MNLISGINITQSALSAEKARMDVVAENIANAYTTRTVEGGAYKRKIVSFESFMDGPPAPFGGDQPMGVKVATVSKDNTTGPAVYNPTHPDADDKGMVEMPNVNLAFEMVDLISSSRAYEANLAVVRNARQMASKALTIGR